MGSAGCCRASGPRKNMLAASRRGLHGTHLWKCSQCQVLLKQRETDMQHFGALTHCRVILPHVRRRVSNLVERNHPQRRFWGLHRKYWSLVRHVLRGTCTQSSASMDRYLAVSAWLMEHLYGEAERSRQHLGEDGNLCCQCRPLVRPVLHARLCCAATTVDCGAPSMS